MIFRGLEEVSYFDFDVGVCVGDTALASLALFELVERTETADYSDVSAHGR